MIIRGWVGDTLFLLDFILLAFVLRQLDHQLYRLLTMRNVKPLQPVNNTNANNSNANANQQSRKEESPLPQKANPHSQNNCQDNEQKELPYSFGRHILTPLLEKWALNILSRIIGKTVIRVNHNH